MNQKDDFLARRFSGEQSSKTTYHSVLRPELEEEDFNSSQRTAWRGIEETTKEDDWNSVFPQQARIQESDNRDSAWPETSPMMATCPIDAWFRLLGRPWSWRWRWVLGAGVATCIVLWMLMAVEPGFHWLYTCVMAACIPVTAITLFCEMDVTRRVTWWVAALVTILGGFLSLFLSLFLWELLEIPPAAELAGLIEEPAKGLVLLILAMFSKQFPGIFSGLALGVCVGSGFAIFETIGYAYGYGEGGAPSTLVLLVRGLLSPLMHLAWTGALGGAMWATRGPNRIGWMALGGWLPWAVLIGMAVIHCIWNMLVPVHGPAQGPVRWGCLALWILIFYLAKRGATQVAAWGMAPKGV